MSSTVSTPRFLARRSVRALFAAVVTAGWISGCGGDDGPVAGPADAGASDALQPGPSDDAARVDVSVDERVPRDFRIGLGVPADGLDADFGRAAWQRASAASDVVTLRLRGGLPWSEIIAGDPLPAAYEAYLADLADRASQLGQDLHLVVDPFDGARGALTADAFGRADTDTASLRFADPAVADGYEDFCESLGQRFTPKYFTPFVEWNAYADARPDEQAPMTALYEQLRETVKFASPTTLVFPEWDYGALRRAVESGDADALAWHDDVDEALDFFAIALHPGTGVDAEGVDASDLAFADREALGALTTRRIVLSAVAFPADGIVRDGEVFASSENSQFNVLAAALTAADDLDVEFVSWATPNDPDAWLLDPCGDAADCDAARLERAYGSWRRHGLVDSSAAERAAWRLWEQYAARPFVR